ncbi:MAG: hypothetical protein AB1633_09455 [Elusimicrobiota bacterium]
MLERAEKEGIIGIYIDLYPVLKEDDFISAYALAISRAISGPVEKALKVLKEIFKTVRPKIVINSEGETAIGIDFVKDINVMIDDVTNATKRYSEKNNKQIVVVFDELTGFVIERFLSSKMSISKEIAAKIVEIAECHPYYVQHLGSSVWKLAQDRRIDAQLVEDALNLTIAEEKNAYNNLWDDLSLNQKKTLKIIAKIGEDKKIYSYEILEKYKITASTIQKMLKSLLLKGIIDKSNGYYEITDVFLKRWLLKN